jgi:hypothetical protein
MFDVSSQPSFRLSTLKVVPVWLNCTPPVPMVTSDPPAIVVSPREVPTQPRASRPAVRTGLPAM